jgi:hypothetical protein
VSPAAQNEKSKKLYVDSKTQERMHALGARISKKLEQRQIAELVQPPPPTQEEEEDEEEEEEEEVEAVAEAKPIAKVPHPKIAQVPSEKGETLSLIVRHSPLIFTALVVAVLVSPYGWNGGLSSLWRGRR